MSNSYKIIITGGNGQLGTTLLKLKKKYNIYKFSKKQLDITNKKKLFGIINKINPKIIINAAAYTNVNKSEYNYKLAKKINYTGVKNLVSICKKLDILLIHISTDYVFYGNKKSSYSEKDKSIPKNKYGESKLMGENFIKRNLTKYFIFRVSWLFGHGKNNFVYKIIQLILNNKNLNIVSNEFSSPTSSEDLMELINKVIVLYKENKKLKYGLYHFNSLNKKISRYEFVIKINNSLNKQKIKHNKINKIINKNSFRPINSFLNTRKIYNHFDLKRKNFNISLNRMIKFYIGS